MQGVVTKVFVTLPALAISGGKSGDMNLQPHNHQVLVYFVYFFRQQPVIASFVLYEVYRARTLGANRIKLDPNDNYSRDTWVRTS